MPGVVGQVVVGQKHLSHRLVVVAEERLVQSHQPRLPDRGTGLSFGQTPRTPIITEHSHAGPDGSRGDYYDLVACRPESGDLRHQLSKLDQVEPLGDIGKDTGS